MTFSSQPTAAKPIGVAIVGTGFGQKIHIPGFQAHPRTEVVAVYHRDRAKGEAIATAHGIAKTCQTLEEILQLPEVDAVSISTPPFLHADMARAALQAGKHVLLEKPITLTAAEARDLYHLADRQGAIATADFEFRCVPAWQRFAELLAEGYVGEKRLIKIDWIVPSRANPEREWNWYARKDCGGGALGAVGSHSFDYIHWLFGPVRRLCANLVVTIPQRPDASSGEWKPVDADDTCLLMLELADGTPCQLTISSVAYEGRGHWLEVYGDRGTLVLGSDNKKDYVHGFRLWASQAGNSLTEVEIPKRLAFSEVYPDGRLAPFIRIVDRWVDGIDQGQQVVPSLREGAYSQLLMDLTHQSSEQNAWVDVPDLATFLGQ